MAAKSTAEVIWHGDLPTGSGLVTPESGAFDALPVSWGTRTERAAHKTSPEELLASAHASCLAMAINVALGKRRQKPEELAISATATFDKVGENYKVTTMELHVRGRIPDMDQATFEEVVRQGDAGCPISNALRGNVEIKLRAELEQSAAQERLGWMI